MRTNNSHPHQQTYFLVHVVDDGVDVMSYFGEVLPWAVVADVGFPLMTYEWCSDDVMGAAVGIHDFGCNKTRR